MDRSRLVSACCAEQAGHSATCSLAMPMMWRRFGAAPDRTASVGRVELSEMRRCLDCSVLSPKSRCPQCASLRRRPRNRRNNAARGGSGWAWQRTRVAVLEREGYRCVDCGTVQVSLQVDHIVPLAAGGSNDLANLRALCRWCHGRRHESPIQSASRNMTKWCVHCFDSV